MNSFVRHMATTVLAGSLSLALIACGQAQPASSEVSPSDAEPAATEAAATETDATPGNDTVAAEANAAKGIDITTLGNVVATYEGAKYIVSDATVDQTTGSDAQADFGLQEVCVVHQPESWGQDGSLGWSRNSISYTYLPTEWGSITYNYSYRNESGAQASQGPSRTTEEAYFDGLGEVQHVTIGDREVAYVVDENNSTVMGIPDLEAQAAAEGQPEGADPAADGRTIAVYAFEKRADKCAFNVSIVCNVNPGAAFDLTGEQLVAQAYEPLEFIAYQPGMVLDAASYRSNLTIADAAGERRLVVALKGGDLLSYGAHQVALVDIAGEGMTKNPVRYDFAPTDTAPEGAEQREVEGHAASVNVAEQSWGTGEGAPVDRVLNAWVDFDGSPLRIEAILTQDEDVDAALTRLVGGGRLLLQ